jgi:hypothetical protein
MSVYDDLKTLIEEKPPKKAIKAKYKGEDDAREIWPHVLGNNPKSGYDVVLCFQGVGPDPPQGYRCFKVDDLALVGNPYIPTTWQPEKKFKYKDVIKQNCVDVDGVEAFR